MNYIFLMVNFNTRRETWGVAISTFELFSINNFTQRYNIYLGKMFKQNFVENIYQKKSFVYCTLACKFRVTSKITHYLESNSLE